MGQRLTLSPLDIPLDLFKTRGLSNRRQPFVEISAPAVNRSGGKALWSMSFTDSGGCPGGTK